MRFKSLLQSFGGVQGRSPGSSEDFCKLNGVEISIITLLSCMLCVFGNVTRAGQVFFLPEQDKFFFFPCGSSFIFFFYVWVKFYFFLLCVGQVFLFLPSSGQSFFFQKNFLPHPLKSNGASLIQVYTYNKKGTYMHGL